MSMLDLRDLANEWQELLDELDPEAHDLPLTDDEIEDLKQDCAKYAELCEQLGVSPVEPDTLRWWANHHEPALIPESEFVEYAQQLAEDIGAIDMAGRWPTNCIDWERAANELASDYTSIRYDGDDYYTRS